MMKGTSKKTTKQILKDVEWLPYNEWVQKHPEYAKWLTYNGFVYVEELDKGRKKKQ